MPSDAAVCRRSTGTGRSTDTEVDFAAVKLEETLYVTLAVVAGMIAPMRHRWERMLTAVERETVTAKGSVSAYQAGRADALADQPVRERTDLPRTTDCDP